MKPATIITACLLLLASTSPAAAGLSKKQRKALKVRLQLLHQLSTQRTAALTLIRDASRYADGNKAAQRDVTRRTLEVQKTYGKVQALLKKDVRRVRRKKRMLRALLKANPKRLNAWEQAVRQRLSDMETLRRNTLVVRAADKRSRPSAFQVEQLRLTNEYRMTMGLRALALDLNLVQAAAGHSLEMRKLRYFAHESPKAERRTPTQRATKAGFKGSAVGENIAQGYRSPRAVHRGWLTSPGHHRNILDPDWERMGVANSSDYWTQVFGRVSPVSS